MAIIGSQIVSMWSWLVGGVQDNTLLKGILKAIAAILLLSFLVTLGLGIVCGGDRILASGETGYQATGAFALDKTPSLVPERKAVVRATNPDILLWGSGGDGNTETGRLTSQAFTAPPLFSVFIAGWVNTPNNQLVVQRLDTQEQLSLVAGNVGNRWKRLYWWLPRAWVGKPVQVVAVDGNPKSPGWIGISSPLQSSFFSWLRDCVPSIALVPLYLLYFALFLTPGLVLATLWMQRFPLHPALTLGLATVFNALLGYLAFWLYFFNQAVGIGASVLLLLATVGYWVQWARGKVAIRPAWSADTVIPTLLMLVVGLLYLAVLFMTQAGDILSTHAGVRFFSGFPPDNILPHMVAEKLYAGQSPKGLFDEWLSSDRPPLQTGMVLLQRPVAFFGGHDIQLHYQLLCTMLQTTWIAALWAVCRMLCLAGWQIAIVSSFAIFSGFFLFNSVYVWPKLIAATLMVFAFAVLQPCLYERRRPTTLETGLAGCAAGLGMMGHGGVVFTIPAIALMLIRPRNFPAVKPIIVGCLLFSLMLAPWMAYQKLYEPPGNRLLKWHLAGVVKIDDRTFSQALKDSYGQLSLSKIAQNKWDNLKTLMNNPYVTLPESEKPYNARRQEFFHTLPALSVLNVGWLIWLLLPWAKQVRQRISVQRGHLVLGVGVASLLVWVLMMFGPFTTIVHQGSYANMLLLGIGLANLISQLPKPLCYILVGLQSGLFFQVWVISSSRQLGDRLLVAANPWMVLLLLLTLVILVGLLRWLSQCPFAVELKLAKQKV
jgi:hypothetical protein